MPFYTVDDLHALADSTAGQYGVPQNLFSALISGESQWKQYSTGTVDPTSGTSALGLAQIFPSTARDPGYGVTPYTGDLYDPKGNLDFGARYLKALYDKVGSWTEAIRRYTGGTAPASTVAAAKAADAGGGGASVTGAAATGGKTCADIPWWPKALCGYAPGTTPGTSTPKTNEQWGDTLFAKAGDLVTRGGLVLLGVLVIVVGIFMLKGKG